MWQSRRAVINRSKQFIHIVIVRGLSKTYPSPSHPKTNHHMKTLDNVATIISLFEKAAEREGYNFCLSHRDEMPQATKADKILWLYTPLFLSQEGTTHGRQRYRVCVALIHRQQKATAAERVAYATYLQDVLIEIFTSLSTSERVAVVESLQSEVPTRGGVNDTVAEMSAEVEMIF